MVAWISLGIAVAGLALSLYYAAKAPGIQGPEGFQLPKIGEGNPIPVLFGTKDIAPQILWYGDLRLGWDNARPTYYASLHFGLCHGELDALTAVIADDKIVWRGRMSQDNSAFFVNSHPGETWTELKAPDAGDTLPVATKDGARGLLCARMGTVNGNNGAEAGSPSDALRRVMKQDACPKGYGVAQVYSLGATLVGRSSYMRPWAFRCQRIHRRRGGVTQWYDAKAAIEIGYDADDLWKYRVQASADDTDYSDPEYDDAAWAIGQGGFSNAAVGETGAKTSTVGTCIAGIDGLSGSRWVQKGMKIWLRHAFPAMPKAKYGIWIYHDDSARVWWNGTELEVKPVIDIENYGGEAAGIEFHRFNSRAEVPVELIDDDGPNVIACRVRDTYDNDGNMIRGSSPTHIYAGVRVGADLANPAKSTDMNPVHAIREVLTDPIWGASNQEADIDDASFAAAADVCHSERLGVSLLWDRQSSAEDFVNEVLRHISGVLYVDRASGKYVIKLIRDDYEVESLLVLDDSNTAMLENVYQRSTAELINQVTVSYSATPRGLEGAVTLHEYGLQQVQGGVTAQKIDYPGFSNYYSASKVALRDLKVLSSPLRSCTILAGRAAAVLNIGDAFVLDKPGQGFDEQVMRVSSIKLGDGRRNQVKIEAMEDVFAMPTEPVVVPAPVYFPPEVLAPLPSDVKATKFFVCQRPDQNDRGVVHCCFLGAHYVVGGNTPMFESWTQVAPGVMRNNVDGPLPDAWFDGVPVDYLNPSGVSSLIGKTVFAYFGGDSSELEEPLQGLYVIDDVGGHFEDYGLPTQVFVSTYATMHRHPDYDIGADYVAGMTFQVQQGEQYGTSYFTLDTANVVLGETPLAFTETEGEFPWVPERRLLTEGQVVSAGFTGDAVDDVLVGPDGAEFDAFLTLEGVPNVEAVPAGPWAVHLEGAWLADDDPGETTTLGAAIYREYGGSRELLFEMSSAPIHTETPTPLDIRGVAPGYHIERTDRLLLQLVVHTTATTAEVHIRYGGAAPQTYLLTPITPREPVLDREDWREGRYFGGVAAADRRAMSVDLTLTPGASLSWLAIEDYVAGDTLCLTVHGGTAAQPITIAHDAADTPSGTAPFFLSSLSGLGSTYLDLLAKTSNYRLWLQLSPNRDYWRLVGGPVS